MQRWSYAIGTLLVLVQAGDGLGAIQTQPLSPIEIVAPEAGAKGGTREAAPRLQEAIKCFEQGQIDRCFDLLKAATETQVNLPPARLMLARLFLSRNRVQEGRANLEQVAAENPEYHGTYLTLGHLALADGRLAEALVNFEKAALLSSAGNWSEGLKRNVRRLSWAGRATVAERRGDWKSAEAALSAWLELEPTNGRARQRLARVLAELGKPAAAVRQQLEQAVKNDRSLEPAAVSMGWLYHARGDRGKAAEWMEYAVKAAPGDPKAHFGFAAWLLEVDRASEAEVHARAAEKLGLRSRDLMVLRGQIARALRNYELAERYFRQVYLDGPSDFRASNWLALALVEQEDASRRRRALELAEANARQHPRATEAISTLGWIYYRMGRKDEAEKALKAAASAGNASSETAYYVAHLLADRGQLEEVKRLLKTAIEAPGIFVHRTRARQWLERLSQQAPQQGK